MDDNKEQDTDNGTSTSPTETSSVNKRRKEVPKSTSGSDGDADSRNRVTKRHGAEDANSKPSKRQRKTPKEVRVLHILKKHKDSKRPASWRSNNKPITITKEQAREELEGLLEILREEEGNPDNLIATFKELASQESDCNSAKRKGDLGMFGRKKMRPEFEEAAFGLDINELSGVVETASGAHILLRLE
jgi:NIMA-interacting peptidyl-prolyl cis-trans isomerase 1